jgi:hypothetical protein
MGHDVSVDMMTYPCWQALRNGPGHFSGRDFQEWKRRENKKLVNDSMGVGEDYCRDLMPTITCAPSYRLMITESCLLSFLSRADYERTILILKTKQADIYSCRLIMTEAFVPTFRELTAKE